MVTPEGGSVEGASLASVPNLLLNLHMCYLVLHVWKDSRLVTNPSLQLIFRNIRHCEDADAKPLNPVSHS